MQKKIPSSSFLIIPPTDEGLRRKLEKRLRKYHECVVGEGTPWKHQYTQHVHARYRVYREAYYKAYILAEVLNTRKPVNTSALALEMRKQWKKAFNAKDFSKACATINKHCGNIPDALRIVKIH